MSKSELRASDLGAAPAARRTAGTTLQPLGQASGPNAEPTAAILHSRTLRSTSESGERAGDDGAKRERGSKVHLAVDTLGPFLALHNTPAEADDRARVGRLVGAVQATTGYTVDLADLDQGYTGEKPAKAARAYGIELEVVELPDAKRGFVLSGAAGPWNAHW